MADTATTRGRLRKQTLASNVNVWGDPYLNTNFDLLDQQVDGVTTIALGTTTATTLTSTNYASDQQRSKAWVFTGTGTQTCTATVPQVEQVKLVINAASGPVVISPAAGTSVTVSAGERAWIYNDGTNFGRGDPTLDKVRAPTAAMSMNGQRITGLAAGTASSDAMRVGEAQTYVDTASSWASTASGWAGTASGWSSTAAAWAGTASGWAGTASGYMGTASGWAGTASGWSGTASGWAGTAAAWSTSTALVDGTYKGARGYSLDALSAVGGVKVTTSDTTPAVLNDKIGVSGLATKSTANPGGNEVLTIAVPAASAATAATGTATSESVTPAALGGWTPALTELTSGQIDTAADFIPVYDASGTVMKKVKPANLGVTGGVTVQANGSTVVSNASTVNFVGASVTGANNSGTPTITIQPTLFSDNAEGASTTGWSTQASASLTNVNTQANTGSRSYQYSSSGGSGNYYIARQITNLASGYSYTVEFYAKMTSGATASRDFRVGTTAFSSGIGSTSFSYTSSWAKYSYTFTATANTVYISWGNDPDTSVTIYIDDIIVKG